MPTKSSTTVYSKKKATTTSASKKKTSRTSTGRKKTSKKAAGQSISKTTSGKPAANKQALQQPAPLPKVGAHVQWKSLPGVVRGKVLAVLTADTELNGKRYKASKEAPRLKLESEQGKICIHKPDSVEPASG